MKTCVFPLRRRNGFECTISVDDVDAIAAVDENEMRADRKGGDRARERP